MEYIFLIFFISIVSFFIFSIIYLIKVRDSMLDIEKNENIVYNEICGGEFDGIGILDLFHNNLRAVRLTLYDNFIIISYRKKIVLKYSDIIKLIISGEITQDPFRPSNTWNKISIEHCRNDISKRINLYLSDCEKTKSMIEKQIKN